MIKQIYKGSKEISFLLAGAIISLVSIQYQEEILENIGFFLIVIGMLLLWGIGIAEWIPRLLYWIVRKINQRCHYVCIYAPYEIKPNNSSWVEVKLEKIVGILKDNKVRYRIHRNDSAFKEYPIILNPYGGTYPENNISTLESLNSIFKYVREGGTYINIADIPFYYAYDKNLGRRIDTTPLAGDFNLERSFLKTIMTQRLNHFVFGITYGEDYDKGVSRIIQLTETSKNLFGKSRFQDGPSGDYTPVIKIPYGKGYFIFSTLSIISGNLTKNLTRIVNSLPE